MLTSQESHEPWNPGCTSCKVGNNSAEFTVQPRCTLFSAFRTQEDSEGRQENKKVMPRNIIRPDMLV
jgi:hypothetical protein